MLVGSRDYRLDQAKGALIFMVVLGHLLAAVSSFDENVIRTVQTVIYSFHMPAFIFLAGITARSHHLTRRVLFFVVLLATALPVYFGWMEILGLDPEFDFLVPYWLTWFLLSMVWWTLSVPFIERFPRAVLGLSISAGLLGGLIPVFDYELSLSRTLAFWPFFVLGRLYGARVLSWAGGLDPFKKIGLVGIAAVPVTSFYVFDVNKLWLYGSRNFEWFDVDAHEGVGMRALVAVSAAVSTLAFLSLIPDRNGYLAKVGRNSLAVYLLHGLVVRLLNPVFGVSLDYVPAILMLAICVVVALITTWLLSLNPVNRAIRIYAETVADGILWPLRRVRRGLERRGLLWSSSARRREIASNVS